MSRFGELYPGYGDEIARQTQPVGPEFDLTEAARIEAAEAAQRLQAQQATDARAQARIEAVVAINEALWALEVEGFGVRAQFRALRINTKGSIDYSGHCKLEGQVRLARDAVALCTTFKGDALVDEVAAICGVGE